MRVTRDADVTFEQFVRGSRAGIRLRAAAMCGDWNAADDLVQETLLILYRRWDDVEPAARHAYLWTVMSHLVTQHGRARWQCESLRDVLPEPARRPAEEDAAAIANLLAIKNALHCLSARQRNAVYLRYWEGLSTKAIAQALQVPAGTVRSDLARAMARLRAILRPARPLRGAHPPVV